MIDISNAAEVINYIELSTSKGFPGTDDLLIKVSCLVKLKIIFDNKNS